MESKDLTAVIQIHYPERLKYLDRIVAAIFSGSLRPAKLILWANDLYFWHHPEISSVLDNFRQVEIIASSFNTLLGRYAAILVSDTPYVFVQDDDLVVGPDTIKALAVAAQNGICYAGIAGMNFGDDPDCAYTAGQWLQPGHKGLAEVILGRCWLAPRVLLTKGMHEVLSGLQPGRADDLVFSSQAGGGKVVGRSGITDLDEEGIGLSHEPQHMDERNAMAARLKGELHLS